MAQTVLILDDRGLCALAATRRTCGMVIGDTAYFEHNCELSDAIEEFAVGGYHKTPTQQQQPLLHSDALAHLVKQSHLSK